MEANGHTVGSSFSSDKSVMSPARIMTAMRLNSWRIFSDTTWLVSIAEVATGAVKMAKGLERFCSEVSVEIYNCGKTYLWFDDLLLRYRDFPYLNIDITISVF